MIEHNLLGSAVRLTAVLLCAATMPYSAYGQTNKTATIQDILANADARARTALLSEIKNYAETGLNNVPGLNVSISGFSAEDSAESYGLNFDYRWSGASSKAEQYKINGKLNTSGSFELTANGLIGFEEDENPHNQISARASLLGNVFYFGGDAAQLNNSQYKKETKRLAKLAVQCTTKHGDANTHLCNKEYNAITDHYRSAIGNNISLRLGGNIGVETDQGFSATNFTYGGSLFLGFKSYDDKDKIKYLNLIDWPAAIIRGFAGFEGSGFSPSGLYFPAVRFAIDQVEPNEKAPRVLLAGDDSNYTRLNIEAVYRSPLFKLGSTPLKKVVKGDVLYLTASYRYYKELSPSDAVVTAGLKHQRMWTFGLSGLLGGLYLSYSTGELPMDVDRDNVVEIGFKKHF